MRKKAAENPGLRVRRATRRDVPKILRLIRDLAKYERLTRGLRLSAKRLRQHGFGHRRYFEALICEREKQPVGYAVYYFMYSTFTCVPVLFIEDIYVSPKERGKGTGKTMMKALARIAVRQDCTQMEWLVLDWNAPSIAFYRRLGAWLDREWVLTRLTGKRLQRLAGG